jgi:Nitroreductase family
MNRRQLLLGGGIVAVGGAGIVGASLLQMGSMDDYDSGVAATRAALAKNPAVPDLIRFATLAASGHNTQPWRFRPGPHGLDILPDLTRRTPVVDPDDHHLFVSLGCAAENLSLAAAARGRGGEVSFHDDIVQVALGTERAGIPSELFQAIPRRQSSRSDYNGRAVGSADLRRLAAAAAVPGVDLVLITERRQIDRITDLVVEGNSAQMADPAFIGELKRWLRFSPREARSKGDGLFSASAGSPALPGWLGPMMFDQFVSAKGENEKYARQIRSSAGVAVFLSERADKDHWVRAGLACQRFALQATALGLKQAYVNQPVEVARLRPELAALVGMPGRRADIVMRFGYGPALPFSARRPVSAVIA